MKKPTEKELDDFLVSHGWAAETRDKYGRTLRRFFADIDDIDNFGAADFLHWLESHGWQKTTQYYACYAVKHWLKFAYKGDHPALELKIKRPKTNKKQRTLSFEQAEKLLMSFDTDKPKGRRDLAMCCLFLDTGLRVSEVARLAMDGLYLDERLLSVIVKGGDWAQARYSTYTRSCLYRWLADRQFIAKCKKVFVGIYTGARMTREGIQTEVVKWGKKAKIGKLSPHDFRRTYATLGTLLGGSERVIMAGGRWKSHETFARYVADINLRHADQYSPVMALMDYEVEQE